MRRQEIEDLDLGCTDHNCVWGHPGGLGTNGGCKCLHHLSTIGQTRAAAGIRVLREIADANTRRVAPTPERER